MNFKKYVILFVVCVAIFCVVFTVKGNLSQSKQTDNPTQVSTVDDDILLFEPQNTTTTTTQSPPTDVSYSALNFDTPKAMWFAFMDYSTILLGKSEEEFRLAIEERFDNAQTLGINTLYVQVRSHGDSYYTSDIYPKGKYYDSDYDPLAIMVEVAHAKGLSIHAWVNPLRCMDVDTMASQDSTYILKSWSEQYSGTYINEVNGYWYLNPYYTEVRQLICDGVAEILNNYQVDGIHIDDYFYPTTDESFDSSSFADSNQTDLLQFRRDNVNSMVSEMYSTIKSINPTVEFGISPQGNMDIDYYQLCADVSLWASNDGYCDYIAPQLYYGFENSTCPYVDTLNLWSDLTTTSSVKLVAGLATYKIGLEDTWAGAGSNEWIDSSDIVGCQIDYAFNNPNVDGVAIYSYSSTFEPTGDTSVVEKVSQEREYIQERLTNN